MSREAFDSIANEEQIWAEFNAWHKNRYGWDLRDTRGHAAEKYDGMVAWAAWQAARAAALEEAAQLCESQCAGISYANGNQGPCLTEFPKECGGRHDGMTYADAIRALKEKE